MRYVFTTKVEPIHTLDAEESNHVVRVLRARVGEEFALVDGEGKRYVGELIDADKRNCVFKTRLDVQMPPHSAPLTLVISPTKSTDRFEWLLEKAMEYGVRRIQPVWTARSERKNAKMDRWQRILISALKQSQQLWLTQLDHPISWNDWLEVQQKQLGQGFIAHCLDMEKSHWFDEVPREAPSWIAIGPEGDFSLEEIEQALRLGVKPVSLGEQRLRTETAGLAAIQMHGLALR